MSDRNVEGELFMGLDGEWRWRVRSTANGNIMATGAEGYKNRGDCLDGLRTVAGQDLKVIDI